MGDKTHSLVRITVDGKLDNSHNLLGCLIGQVLVFKFGIRVFRINHKQLSNGATISGPDTGSFTDEIIGVLHIPELEMVFLVGSEQDFFSFVLNVGGVPNTGGGNVFLFNLLYILLVLDYEAGFFCGVLQIVLDEHHVLTNRE